MLPSGTLGKYHSLDVLSEKISGDRGKEKFVSRFVCKYNRDFKVIAGCNLPMKMKKRILLDMVHHRKHSIFNDIVKLDEDERRWLYHFVITKWRMYRDEKARK